jgi:hypothetical protein
MQLALSVMNEEVFGRYPMSLMRTSCHSSLLNILFLFQGAVAPYSIFTSRRKQSY